MHCLCRAVHHRATPYSIDWLDYRCVYPVDYSRGYASSQPNCFFTGVKCNGRFLGSLLVVYAPFEALI